MAAIETRGLTKKYGSVLAVDSLCLSVEEGELFGLLGVNGAGKTTAIKMLTCLTRPTAGDALLLGDSIVSAPERVKQKTAVSPQETAVAPNLTVRENLEFTARIYSIPAPAERAAEMLGQFGLAGVEKRRARTLSGGMQRRLSIAMALISDPKVLFLDEPTLGLDVLARRELWDAIRSLKGRVTTILTTHYMEEAEELCDRIGVMAAGRLITTGTAAELTARTGAKNFESAFVALVSGKGAAQ